MYKRQLLAFGLTLLQGHQLLGAGPDGFARAAANQHTFALHGKINAHNGMIEVAVDYGLVVLALLVAVWIGALVTAWRAGRAHRKGVRAATAGVLMGLLVASPLLACANSQFIGPNVTAAWLAVMLCLTALVLGDSDQLPGMVQESAGEQRSSADRSPQHDAHSHRLNGANGRREQPRHDQGEQKQ